MRVSQAQDPHNGWRHFIHCERGDCVTPSQGIIYWNDQIGGSFQNRPMGRKTLPIQQSDI